jgi:hypothetical protein
LGYHPSASDEKKFLYSNYRQYLEQQQDPFLPQNKVQYMSPDKSSRISSKVITATPENVGMSPQDLIQSQHQLSKLQD